MNKLRPVIHVVGGWAFDTPTLKPLATAAAELGDIHLHRYDVDFRTLRREPGRPWYLLGWSLGGLRALEAVLSGTIVPDALGLISSTSRFCRDEHYGHGVPRTHLRALAAGMKRQRLQTLEAFFRNCAAPDPLSDELCKNLADQADAFSDEQLASGLAMLDVLDLRQRLGEIRTPVMILHGGSDNVIPWSASGSLAAALPDATLDIHPGAGHDLPIRHAGWVVNAMSRHWSSPGRDT